MHCAGLEVASQILHTRMATFGDDTRVPKKVKFMNFEADDGLAAVDEPLDTSRSSENFTGSHPPISRV